MREVVEAEAVAAFASGLVDAADAAGFAEAADGAGVSVEAVDWHHPEAERLRVAQQVEIAVRYGGPGAQPDELAAFHDVSSIVTTVLVWAQDPAGTSPASRTAVGVGSVRDLSGVDNAVGGVHPNGTGEVKRVYVDPRFRGRGLSRRLMVELERRARRAGLRRLVLESGTMQPEAMGLYLSLGYDPIESYGAYAGSPNSRCFGRELAGGADVVADRPVVGVAAGAPGARVAGADRPAVGVAAGAPAARVAGAAESSCADSCSRTGELRSAGSGRAAAGGPDEGSGPAAGSCPEAVRIRPVAWDDPGATQLRRENFEMSTSVLYPGAARIGFERMDAAVGEQVVVAFVAELADDDERPGRVGPAGPLGFVALTRFVPAGEAHPDTGELRKLYVRPAARGRGVARALVAAAEDAARERGMSRLVLETGIRQPAAVRLYTALGYRPIRPYPPYEDNAVALCFAKALPAADSVR